MQVDEADLTAKRKKLVVVGDSNCGKTQLLYRFTHKTINEKLDPAVGTTMSAHSTASLNVDGHMVELVLWDTPGLEIYDRLRPLNYPEADVILVCFSLDDPDSLENVKDVWVPEVRHFCPRIPIILVGNKKELVSDKGAVLRLKRQGKKPVKTSKGQRVADKIGAFAYCENSATTGEGVEEVFQAACRACKKYELLYRQTCKPCSIL